jgi:arginyl-tRNA synthetase
MALGEAYRVGSEAYEAGGAEAEEIKIINTALYDNSDVELSALRAAGIATSRTHLNELLRQLGTVFDFEITESAASIPGAMIVRSATGTTFKESDGAVIYEGEKVGLHTRVFLNAKGLPTYEAKDVGHFTLKEKAEPQWDHSVIVTGNEQTEYFKVVFAVLRELFPQIGDRPLEHIPTGFLTLTTGKMSSRKGNVLTGESLLGELKEAAEERVATTITAVAEDLTEKIAVAALKYQILKHSVGSNIVFDKDKALSFEGDSGPYLQYTYARIGSLLEKATLAGLSPSLQRAPAIPYEIERILYRFESVITTALIERAPQQLVVYLTKLAGVFNTFYAHEKIADTADEFAPYKMAVTQAVGMTLKNGLWALGIVAPLRL